MQFDLADAGSTGAFGSISTTLLGRAQSNDPAAHDQLIELYGPLVYRWCRSSLQPDDAADVVQEVFLTLLRAIRGFDHARANATFRGWLRTITRNKVRDALRRQGKMPRAEGGTAAQLRMADLPDQAPAADEQLSREALSEADESSLVLQGAMELVRKNVRGHTWQAFQQTVLEHREVKEVAARLGMKAGTVRHAKMRVLRHLRELLGDDLYTAAGDG